MSENENENTAHVTHESVERAENATGDHTDVDRIRADGLVDADDAATTPDHGDGVEQLRADGLPGAAENAVDEARERASDESH